MKSQLDRFTGGGTACYPAPAGFSFMLRVQVKQSQDILGRIDFHFRRRLVPATLLSWALRVTRHRAPRGLFLSR